MTIHIISTRVNVQHNKFDRFRIEQIITVPLLFVRIEKAQNDIDKCFDVNDCAIRVQCYIKDAKSLNPVTFS